MADSSDAPVIVHDDAWQTVFRRCDVFDYVLWELKVFLGGGAREVRITEGSEISPYTNWNHPELLHTMGFASYHMGGSGELIVGNYCSIASWIAVMGERHPIEFMSSSAFNYDNGKPNFEAIIRDYELPWTKTHSPIPGYGPLPIIEHDCWIGAGVTLGRGITIGTGAVVATGAIVTKDVEPYTIVAGVPARPVRKRFNDKTIELLLATRWWEYANIFGNLDTREPDKFLPTFEAALEAVKLVPVPTVRITRELIKERLALRQAAA